MRAGFVYHVRLTELENSDKIGFSTDPYQRFVELRRVFGDLTIVDLIAGTTADESLVLEITGNSPTDLTSGAGHTELRRRLPDDTLDAILQSRDRPCEYIVDLVRPRRSIGFPIVDALAETVIRETWHPPVPPYYRHPLERQAIKLNILCPSKWCERLTDFPGSLCSLCWWASKHDPGPYGMDLRRMEAHNRALTEHQLFMEERAKRLGIPT